MKLKKAIGYTLAAAFIGALLYYLIVKMSWIEVAAMISGAVVLTALVILLEWLLKEDKEAEDER